MPLGGNLIPAFLTALSLSQKGQYMGTENNSLLPEWENPSANRCWSISELVLRGLCWRRVPHKPPQLGINRKAAPQRVVKQACSLLHTSTLNLFILLSCSWGTSCSNGCTTDDWETRTHTQWAQGFSALGREMVSYLFFGLVSPTILAPDQKKKKQTRKMLSKTDCYEHFKELWRWVKRQN